MKAIIWIIIIAVVAWGIWYFMKDKNSVTPSSYSNAAGQVQGASDTYNGSGNSGSSLNASSSVGIDVKG